MDQRGDEVHTSSTEATGASREGVVRWVLIIGLFLAIALLSIVWMTGALTQDAEDSHQNVGREIADTESGDERGEPIMPGTTEGTSPASDADLQSTVAHPEATSTPGDAPAGDPQPNAQ